MGFEKWLNSGNGVAVISTLTGLVCNIFVKGVMKSIGFIFKNSLKTWPDMNQTLAVLTPSTMHLVFNVMALFVPLLGDRIGLALTAILGAAVIVLSLIAASFIEAAALLFIPLGIMLGLGCALNFHSGVKLVNHLTSRNNGFANGIAQAGNTMGAIAVSFAVAGYFSHLDFKMSLIALGLSLLVLIPISAAFYWPNKFLNSDPTFKAAKMDAPAAAASTAAVFRSYKYYFFIISQTLNAVGFLNFTTYLAAHLDQANGWSDLEAASAYAVNQSVDFFTRLVVPMLSDRSPKLRPFIYIVGVIGTGMTMALLPYATSTTAIYTVCAVSGIFSACFIGIWNSLVKDEVGSANFYVVYSHSLGVCGVVQFLVTILVVFLVQSGSSGGQQNYGDLLVIFGSIMSMAAIPIFGILICNGVSSNYGVDPSQDKLSGLDLDAEKEAKTICSLGAVDPKSDLKSGSSCQSILKSDSE